MKKNAFTLVEMLMALLIVSVILSAALPVITKRVATQAGQYNRNNSVPIGMIAIWGTDKPLPDNTWLECNGQAIPNGIEYEEIRQIYGTNLPDYRGVFLRGYGSISHTQNNGSTTGNTATTHASGAIGAVQGDATRLVRGWIDTYALSSSGTSGPFINDYDAAQGDSPTSQAKGLNGFTFDNSRVVPVSNEIRPVNKAVRYIIKVRN